MCKSSSPTLWCWQKTPDTDRNKSTLHRIERWNSGKFSRIDYNRAVHLEAVCSENSARQNGATEFECDACAVGNIELDVVWAWADSLAGTLQLSPVWFGCNQLRWWMRPNCCTSLPVSREIQSYFIFDLWPRLRLTTTDPDDPETKSRHPYKAVQWPACVEAGNCIQGPNGCGSHGTVETHYAQIVENYEWAKFREFRKILWAQVCIGIINFQN